jgi:hypothetical protein
MMGHFPFRGSEITAALHRANKHCAAGALAANGQLAQHAAGFRLFFGMFFSPFSVRPASFFIVSNFAQSGLRRDATIATV